jgi:glycosyltransferase involved in cell wall biosynthesis
MCAEMLRHASGGKVVQIDNAVDSARIIPRLETKADGLVRVISVGRLIPEKNYELLLLAASALSDLSFEISIVGEGPERHELENQMETLGLRHKVRFLGNVSNVPELLAQSDVFAMSSCSEGLPIALIEATLAGLPVVVTNVGGCAEVIHKVCNGIVVETLEVDAYAQALRRLLESTELRGRLSLNAHQNSNLYQLGRAADRHLRLYASLVGESLSKHTGT